MSEARTEGVYVLDACALIAYLNGESGSDKVKDVLAKAIRLRAHFTLSPNGPSTGAKSIALEQLLPKMK